MLTNAERKAIVVSLYTANFSRSPGLRSRLISSLTADRLAHLEPPDEPLPSPVLVALLLVVSLVILALLGWAIR